MRIRMKSLITGTHDGERWPDPGEETEVADEIAEALIDQDVAEPVGAPKERAAAEKAIVKPRGAKRGTHPEGS